MHFLILSAFLLAKVLGQDPAQGWLGYAKGVNPSGTGVLTKVEAYWKVPADPQESGAFFSPWFGIESSDNLNLIQPVNPWTGDHWEIYNEYFQWRPTHNENSRSHTVKAGDVVYGRVTFDQQAQSYTMYHSDVNDKWSVSTTIPVQRSFNGYKKYTIVYFVMEKVWRCAQYPADGQVTFTNISVYYDGQKVQPKWTTAYVDNNCDCRAHIQDESTISITWNTRMDHGKKYIPPDFSVKRLHEGLNINGTEPQLFAHPRHVGGRLRKHHHHHHHHGHRAGHRHRSHNHGHHGHRHHHHEHHRRHGRGHHHHRGHVGGRGGRH